MYTLKSILISPKSFDFTKVIKPFPHIVDPVDRRGEEMNLYVVEALWTVQSTSIDVDRRPVDYVWKRHLRHFISAKLNCLFPVSVSSKAVRYNP
jgi:hypothetical protein